MPKGVHYACSNYIYNGNCMCGGKYEVDCGSRMAECHDCLDAFPLNFIYTCYMCKKTKHCTESFGGFDYTKFDMQSQDQEMETVAETLQTVTFNDTGKGDSDGFSVDYDDLVSADAAEGAGLAEFLSRPVRIHSFTWNESDAIGTTQTIRPWHLFFNNTNVKFRTNNFGFIRCNLKIKVMINASPFYYGSMRVAYQPLPTFVPTTIINDAAQRWFIPLSQRPGIWLSPEKNEGGEMILPFFYHKNWLEIQNAVDFTDFGLLNFVNYTQLDSANGTTGTGVSIQVYAWAEDVHISGPSVGLAMQSQDEYGQGPVSRIASTVGSVAGALKKIPVIGKFATATEIGAKAIGGIAKLFGFTNVPVIENVMPYKPNAFPPLASTEIGYPVEKLTLDAKNELSIDPGVLGLPAEDELAISYIAQKESYLTSFNWTGTDAIDTLKFTSLVTPWLLDNDGVANQTKFYMTPMAHVSYPFRHWRGDIIFKFKFIASKYHKGRVRISFDPQGYTATNLQNTVITSGIVYTQIVDLETDTEVEFRIPYQQAVSWLLLDDGLTDKLWATGTSPGLTLDDTKRNGLITLRVLTVLTSPQAISSIPVQVFVRAADNFELANPSEFPSNFTPFAIQSQDEVMGDATTEYVPERYRVNFGECVRSLRPLMRRSNYHTTLWINGAVTDAWRELLYNFTRFPKYYGYDPAGIDSAKGTLVPASNFPFSFNQATIYNWMAPAYLGQRGSTHWTFNVDAPGTLKQMLVTRRTRNWPGTTISQFTNTVLSQASASRSATVQVGSTAPGAAITNQLTNAGLTVSCPNYTQYKFQSTTPARVTVPASASATNDGSYNDWYSLFLSSYIPPTGVPNPYGNGRVCGYFGVGTDFNLYWYLNTPVFYIIGAPAL